MGPSFDSSAAITPIGIKSNDRVVVCTQGMEIDKGLVDCCVFAGLSTLRKDNPGIVHELVSELCSGGTQGVLVTARDKNQVYDKLRHPELGIAEFIEVGSFSKFREKGIGEVAVSTGSKVLVFEDDDRDISGIIGRASTTHDSFEVVLRLDEKIEKDLKDTVDFINEKLVEYPDFNGKVFIIQGSYKQIEVIESRKPEYSLGSSSLSDLSPPTRDDLPKPPRMIDRH